MMKPLTEAEIDRLENSMMVLRMSAVLPESYRRDVADLTERLIAIARATPTSDRD